MYLCIPTYETIRNKRKKIGEIKHLKRKFPDISFNTATTECQNNAFVHVIEIIKTQSESYLDNEWHILPEGSFKEERGSLLISLIFGK